MTNIQELKELLKFARDYMRYEIPESGICEYDFCVYCGKPDWKHEENCKAVQWAKKVNEILEG